MRTIANRHRVALGGLSLVVATLLFAGVFSYLAATFGYPDVLDQPAAAVLPALLGLGTIGRVVWVLYGVIPLLLIPTGLGVREAARHEAPCLGRIAVWLAYASAAAMMIGLLRWPSLHWSLAQHWTTASPVEREAIAARFDAANFYLGNVIGEFAGELLLNGFFLASALALSAAYPARRWLAFGGIVACGFGWVAMFRNITSLVAPVADINNLVLPLWMLVLGVVLLLSSRRRDAHALAG